MSFKNIIFLFIIAVTLSSCLSPPQQSKNNFQIDYIGGGVEGLMLNNLMTSYLKSMSMYNNNSHLRIIANVSHSSNLYITNMNNTSDRELITTDLKITIYDEKNKCDVLRHKDIVSQYYVLSPNINFISNTTAQDSIKRNNIEILVIKFAQKILPMNFSCIDD